MIIIHAYFKVEPKQRNKFLEIAGHLTKHSKAEEGNITYQYYENPEEPNTFVFIEKWKDQTAIQIHEETSHFKGFESKIDKLLCEPLHAELFEVSIL